MRTVLKEHLEQNTSLTDIVSTSTRVSASVLRKLGQSLEVVAFKCLTCSNDGVYRNNEDEAHQVEQILKASLSQSLSGSLAAG